MFLIGVIVTLIVIVVVPVEKITAAHTKVRSIFTNLGK